MSRSTLLAVDPGATAAKRVARAPGRAPAPLADAASGGLRAPPAWHPAAPAATALDRAAADERALACLAWARRDVVDLGGLALLTGDEEEARALGAALRRLAPDLTTAALPGAVAAALAAGEPPADASHPGAGPGAGPGADPGAGSAAVDAVLDLGHQALRLSIVRWHRVGRGVFPTLEATWALGAGGAALDAALRRVATGACDAPAFHELKELFSTRGPWVRAWRDQSARLDAGAGAAAVREFLRGLDGALTGAAERARAAGARRVVVTGGLLHLAPLAAAVQQALAPLPLAAAADPLFAAGRGGLLALERPMTPRAHEPVSLVVRTPQGVQAVELAPRGASLPDRFGPLRLRGPGGRAVVRALEGQATLEAQLTIPPGPVDVRLSWDFGRGWALEADGQPPAPLTPASPEAARGVRDALSFAWDAHSRPVPLDVVLVFRATQGGGEAVGRVTHEAVGALATVAITHNPDVRLRAIAVGDHPQGHLRPAYVTQAQPAWTPRVDELTRWTAERLERPVDGIDAPEAYECALREAADLDWRPEATRLLLLLADAPPHTPDEPPYCPVDWRAEVKRLGEQGVRVVPVHVAAGGVPPSLRRQALAFLEGVGQVHTLRGGPLAPDLAAAVTAAASVRRMDPSARRVLDDVPWGL